MTKFHIGKNGKPSKCTATKGNCPYGDESKHFNNIEEAQKYIESKYNNVYNSSKRTQNKNINNSDKKSKQLSIRKLMTARNIGEIRPIEGADAIEVATIGGWEVVVKKGLHSPGEKVAYFEIDSFLPEGEPVFEEFMARGTRKMLNDKGEKVTGHVLRTIKLRGQVSQGLIIPLKSFDGLNENSTPEQVSQWAQEHGVMKYEPIVTNRSTTSPLQAGLFPTKYATKTDSERVQNLTDEFIQSLDKDEWYATEKVDGTSSTFFVDEEGNFRLASRNYELKFTDDEGNLQESIYTDVVKKYNLDKIMKPGQVVQGEIVGPGIQGNKLQLKETKLLVFSSEGADDDTEMQQFLQDNSVPKLELEMPNTVNDFVKQVDGMKSSISPKV